MRSNALVYVISIIVAMTIGWSLFNPSFGGSIEYLIMLVFFIMIAWIILVAFVPDHKERGYLISIFLVALGLRILVSILVHTLLPRGYFAPDEGGYIENGKLLANAWSGSSFYPSGKPLPQTIVSAILFFIFGNNLYVALLFENFIGAMTVLNVYFITKRLFNKQSAKYASLVTTILPSLVLWSSLLLKDPNTQFLVTFIIHLTLRLKERLRISNLALLIGSIALIGFFRGYLLIIVFMAVASSFITFHKETFIRNLIIITVFAMVFAALFSSYEAKTVPKYETGKESTLQSLQQIRSGFYTGGSKMLGHVNISTPTNALMYSPLLLTVFFLAPFPWDITGSVLHNLATMESLVWYFFFYYAIKGIIRSLKEGKFDVMPVLVMIGVLSIAYALAITNMGAAYRFRAQVSVLLLVFTGYGLYLRKQEHKKKYAMPHEHKAPHPSPSP
jgi:4-amino-4-deoxy-L-arabinose transferase-like glycosyltransferase